MIRIFTIFFFLLYIFIDNFGQSRSELEKQRKIALKEISETQEILSTLQVNKQNSLEMLELINRKLIMRNNLINNLSNDINKVDLHINEINKQIDQFNHDIKEIKKEYGRLIYLSYLNRNRYNSIMFILSAKDINQAYKRIKYIRQYSDYRKQQVKAISNLSVDLGEQIDLLESQKQIKSRLLSDKESEYRNLKTEETEKTTFVKKLKLQERELVSKLKEKNRIADKLNREIERIIKAEIKSKSSKKTSTETYSLTPEEKLLSSNFKENRGKLPWPTERGIITGYFGERNHPDYKNVKIKNDGIDISSVPGSYVRAIFDGEVRHIFSVLGANYTILIRHGNFYSLYSNIVDVRVKVGEKVKTKQILGKIFTDEATRSSILHIELYENLNKLDPQLWLTKN